MSDISMYTVIVKLSEKSLDEVIPGVHADEVDDLIKSLWVKYPKAWVIRAMLT